MPTNGPSSARGRPSACRCGGRYKVGSSLAVRDALRAGFGLSLVPRVYVQDDLASGALRAVLDDWRPVQTDIYVVYPSRRHMVAKVRAFIDFLVEELGPPGPEARAGRRRSIHVLTAVHGDVATVMNAAASLQTKATSAATSSGSPSRPSGICGRIFSFSTSSGTALTMLVAR